MTVELSSEDALARDQTLIALRGLAERHPQEVMAAGGRLFDRATLALAMFEEGQRAAAAARRSAVALARDIVLGRSDMPPPPRRETVDFLAYPQVADEYKRLKADIAMFQSIAAELPELAQLDLADAYVRARGLHGVRCAASQANPSELSQGSSDPTHYEASARHELGLGERPKLMGLFLGQEVARIADEPRGRLRRDLDWWEVCAATLLAEDPETSTATLGMGAELRCGEWYRSGEGTLFDHREGIRAYAGADPDAGKQREVARHERLWALATGAVSFLVDWERRAARARRDAPSAEVRNPAATNEVLTPTDAQSPEADALGRVLATIESIPNVDFDVPLPVRQKRAAEIRERLYAEHGMIDALLARYVPEAHLPSPCGYCRGPEALRNPIENLLACYDQCQKCREEARRAVQMAIKGLAGEDRGHFLAPEVIAARINASTAKANAQAEKADKLRAARPKYRLSTENGVTRVRVVETGGDKLSGATEATASGSQDARDTSGFRASESREDRTAAENQFYLRGDFWTVTFAGSTEHVSDSLGMSAIRDLLMRPGQSISAARLLGEPEDHSPGQEVLDASALGDLRTDQRVLEQALEHARESNDVELIDQIEDQIEKMSQSITSTLGPGKKRRAFRGPREKQRERLGKRLTAAIAKVAAKHPACGAHLDAAIKPKAGHAPRYEPDEPTTWVCDAPSHDD